MLTGKFGQVWHQHGAAKGSAATGRWKIEFVEDGDYKISLRRFPRESGLDINATFPEQKRTPELDRIMPASVKSDFKEAYIYVAGLAKSAKIKADQDEVNFTSHIPAGKYDMEAQLIDENNVVHPAYYVYIEKL
jgi:hypothetical protein